MQECSAVRSGSAFFHWLRAMQRLRIHGPLIAIFTTGALLVVWLGSSRVEPASRGVPTVDWDIRRLAAFLNERGLELRVVATRRDSSPEASAFLTTTDKEWKDLNLLIKGSGQKNKWRGTLYCEHDGVSGNWFDLPQQWGDCCLAAGPFLFYGDPELLARVRVSLDTFPEE